MARVESDDLVTEVQNLVVLFLFNGALRQGLPQGGRLLRLPARDEIQPLLGLGFASLSRLAVPGLGASEVVRASIELAERQHRVAVSLLGGWQPMEGVGIRPDRRLGPHTIKALYPRERLEVQVDQVEPSLPLCGLDLVFYGTGIGKESKGPQQDSIVLRPRGQCLIQATGLPPFLRGA